MPKQEISMKFPFRGIDNSKGYTRQDSQTTQDGINVRVYDAGTDRRRGGSRAGITPFLGAGSTFQVSGFNKIQSLSSIVTADQEATFDTAGTVMTIRMNYSETDSPPARNAPQVETPFKWYTGAAPNFPGVSGILSPADGGGTGQGTCTFHISTDGTLVTLVATFVSAGFPGPYFYSGPGQVQTLTQFNSAFFNPALSGISGNWTVVTGSFIGNLFFTVFVA